MDGTFPRYEQVFPAITDATVPPKSFDISVDLLLLFKKVNTVYNQKGAGIAIAFTDKEGVVVIKSACPSIKYTAVLMLMK